MDVVLMRSLTIDLPWPVPALHSHNKGHWRSKVVEVRKLRDLAMFAVRQACPVALPRWELATIDYLFYCPDNRRRDQANLIQAMKPAVDGIVDSGLIPDDCWQVLAIGKVVCVVVPKNPFVSLQIRKRTS